MPKDFDPETQYVAWNGDIREKDPKADADGGAFARRAEDGLATVTSYEVQKPSKAFKPVPTPTAAKPTPKGHQFDVALRPKLSPEGEVMHEARMAEADRVRKAAAKDLKKRRVDGSL